MTKTLRKILIFAACAGGPASATPPTIESFRYEIGSPTPARAETIMQELDCQLKLIGQRPPPTEDQLHVPVQGAMAILFGFVTAPDPVAFVAEKNEYLRNVIKQLSQAQPRPVNEDFYAHVLKIRDDLFRILTYEGLSPGATELAAFKADIERLAREPHASVQAKERLITDYYTFTELAKMTKLRRGVEVPVDLPADVYAVLLRDAADLARDEPAPR